MANKPTPTTPDTKEGPDKVPPAMKAAIGVAQDMGVLRGGSARKPLTPKQAAAEEKKAKKAHEQWMKDIKKSEEAESRYKLFCEVYTQVRIAAGERNRAAVIGLKLLDLIPSVPQLGDMKVSAHKALRSMLLDQTACADEAWSIVNEITIFEPKKPQHSYCPPYSILSGCGH